jgi:hypothetical protein
VTRTLPVRVEMLKREAAQGVPCATKVMWRMAAAPPARCTSPAASKLSRRFPWEPRRPLTWGSPLHVVPRQRAEMMPLRGSGQCLRHRESHERHPLGSSLRLLARRAQLARLLAPEALSGTRTCTGRPSSGTSAGGGRRNKEACCPSRRASEGVPPRRACAYRRKAPS